MRFLLPLFWLLVPATSFAVGAAWPLTDSPRFWILGEGLSHLSFDGYYFQSTANYDSTGIANQPATMDTARYTNIRAHGAFGFAPKISLFAQVDARAISTTVGPGAGANISPGKNTGFGDAFVGFRGLLYRSRATDRVYPTEWSPDSFVIIAEGTWNFPLYDKAISGKPPLGDQSNDVSGIARIAWYTNEWLAFSAGGGYVYRTAGYAPVIPLNLRADASLQERYRVRFWTEFQSIQRTSKSDIALNTSQPDPIPNGSLLFKSFAPTLRVATLGAAYLISKEWELAGGAFFTASGTNSAKGVGAGFGLAWRPYQVPEIRYEEYRQQQIERLKSEKREYRRKEVVKYGFRATIVKVSTQGNYVKILYGEKDRVRVGDTFYIMPPDTMQTQARRPVASATAVQVQPDAAFLHVEERYQPDLAIQEGFETRQVYFDSN